MTGVQTCALPISKRDLAQARYNVLLGGLRLRQANGSLSPEDLQSINTLLLK